MADKKTMVNQLQQMDDKFRFLEKAEVIDNSHIINIDKRTIFLKPDEFTAGLCITLQNGFNINISGKIGVWELTTLVHGVAFATMIMLMVQLFLSVFMDTFGLFGLDKVPLSVNRILGLAIRIIGILIYKLK